MASWYLLYALFQLPGGLARGSARGASRRSDALRSLWSLTDRTGWAGRRLPGLLASLGDDGRWPRRASSRAATKAIGAVSRTGSRRSRPACSVSCMSARHRPRPAASPPSCSGRSRGSRSSRLYRDSGTDLGGHVRAMVPARYQACDWGRTATAVTHVLTPVATSLRQYRFAMLLLCSQQFLRAAAMVFFMTWFPGFCRRPGACRRPEAGSLAACHRLRCERSAGLLGGAASDWLLRGPATRRLADKGLRSSAWSCAVGLVLAAYFARDARSPSSRCSASARSGARSAA